MGLFDLRCALSGLSVHPRGYAEPFACSLLLVEWREERWVPLTTPISGSYDRYGAVNVPSPHSVGHADFSFTEAMLGLLLDDGALRVVPPMPAAGHSVLTALTRAQYDGRTVTFEGRAVRTCIYRDDVAQAIVNADAGEETGRLESHFLAARRAYEKRGYFADPPPETKRVMDRFGAILRWLDATGGLRPVLGCDGTCGDPVSPRSVCRNHGDAAQHGDEDFARYGQQALDSGHQVLQHFVERWRERDMEHLQRVHRREQRALMPHLRAAERTRSEVIEWSLVQGALRGVGVDDAAVGELTRTFGVANDKGTLGRLLVAKRPANPTCLAPHEGTVEIQGKVIAIRHPVYGESQFLLGGRSVVVDDGANVNVGDVLTTGIPCIHDQLEIFGVEAARNTLAGMLGDLLGVSGEVARALATPMFSLVYHPESGLLVSAEQWSAWASGDQLDGRTAARAIHTGYDTLAHHVDPRLEAILDSMSAARPQSGFASDDTDVFRWGRGVEGE